MGGYGDSFSLWLFQPHKLRNFDGKPFEDGKRHPYYSFGNGAAMRVSACGWAAQSIEDALILSCASLELSRKRFTMTYRTK